MPFEARDRDASRPRPGFIGPMDRPLFAWHHPGRAESIRHAAVVLCPPLGFDYVCVYRAWRVLAERLAAQGFDVLRFEYDGTGNSAGGDSGSGRVQAWRESVVRVVAEAREIVGTNHVAIVGLRLGAILALDAASALGGVDRLVLWSASASGRAFVRELRAFARLSRQDHAAEPPGDADIDAAGFPVGRETLDVLARWDVAAIHKAPAPDVLIVHRDDLTPDRAVARRLEAVGSRVTEVQPAGTAEVLLPPTWAKVPDPVFESVAAWLDGWHPRTPGPDGARSFGPREAMCGSSCTERAVRFGPEQRLFGVLTTPARQSAEMPAIVFLTTGAEYHIGPNRLYVRLARDLAALGHTVLRYDLGGIGDSLQPPGAAESVAYPDHAVCDLRHALELARSETPARNTILVGLCSGGWLAFVAARDGLPIDAIVSINPPLYLRDGSTSAMTVAEYDEVDRYRRSVRDPSKWNKALTGRAAYGVVLRLVAASAGRVLARTEGRVTGRFRSALARDLDVVAARGIRALFVFSRGDYGLEYFQQHWRSRFPGGRDGRRLIRHVVVDDAGHTFRPQAAQAALRDIVHEFIARHTADAAGRMPLVPQATRTAAGVP